MTNAGKCDPALTLLAQRAGILTRWEDVAGRWHDVSEPVVRHLLDALGVACMTSAQIKDSLRQIEADRAVVNGDLVVARAGQATHLKCDVTGRWTLVLESGQSMAGTLEHVKPGWVRIPPVSEAGYHALSLGNLVLTLAVVPAQAPRPYDAGVGEPRRWGLVAQIYSLHETRESSGLTGSGKPGVLPVWMQGRNFSTVGKLAGYAAREGASALALSPAHAMFSADPQRYSPYSPSSRLFLNVSYADPVQVLGHGMVQQALRPWSPADIQAMEADSLLPDWPRVASL